MSKVVVIGGGVSGLISSIYASINNDVIILERLDSLGKKILVTGNGRCNYWNSDITPVHYNSNNKELIGDIINEENKNKVLSFFDRLNLIPYIKNGYYYPYSKEASTIRNILLKEVSDRNIKVINNYKVENIVKDKDKFIINGDISCDKVIVASGSLSYYKDMTNGYDIARSFGHNIIKVLPSLVQLCAKEDLPFLKMWKNVRCEVKVSIDSDIYFKEEKGEIMLTSYGVSGICIFNLSGVIARLLDSKKKAFININFAPWCDDFKKYLTSSISKYNSFTVYRFLQGVLHSKIIDVILFKSGINKDRKLSSLESDEIDKLCTCITKFNVEITGTKSFLESQVCSGGVSLSEINRDTMESLLVKNLYFAGEIVDIDGDCGGFNLAFAFISGILAGEGASRD